MEVAHASVFCKRSLHVVTVPAAGRCFQSVRGMSRSNEPGIQDTVGLPARRGRHANRRHGRNPGQVCHHVSQVCAELVASLWADYVETRDDESRAARDGVPIALTRGHQMDLMARSAAVYPTTEGAFTSAGEVSRRGFLQLSASGAVALGRTPGRVPSPQIHPRDAWGSGVPPRGPLTTEQDSWVRFLLVHHTQTPNSESPESVPARLRSMFRHHTGTKGWNDIAYNFLVDPFGGIWEGRAGSLAGPVKPDATGGSQGHAILGCFIGDHTVVPPTEAAQAAMSSLLAWLAARYQIDLFAGRNITFVSEGSNRWARGTSVVTDPIAGHRDMSRTECPLRGVRCRQRKRRCHPGVVPAT